MRISLWQFCHSAVSAVLQPLKETFLEMPQNMYFPLGVLEERCFSVLTEMEENFFWTSQKCEFDSGIAETALFQRC